MRVSLMLLSLCLAAFPFPAKAQSTYWHAGNFRYLPSTSGDLVPFVGNGCQ